MEKHIMLAFVSPVSKNFADNEIIYPDIQGKQYAAIQTNESAIVYIERMLNAQKNSLSKIFLIASDFVKKNNVPPNKFVNDVPHLEFLKLRVAKECPQLDGKFSVQDYLDGVTALKDNILQTAEIADAVMKFAQENFKDKITVHADMTGGFRHASMLMLSIIQLLKYRGLEIGEILYSDPAAKKVYRANEIQRMFSLITGADEFVNFGSVKALQDYFGTPPPPAVNDLLNAMNRFSDAIKICRTSAIEIELAKLGGHIKDFRKHSYKDLRSELFAKIIDRIEREYGDLISGQASRIEIIRWCMDKGFWQQAMTLCTEWLPEEFVTRKICVPKIPNFDKYCESKCNDASKTWQQYFIINFSIEGFFDNLRKALRKGDINFPKLEKFWDEYKRGQSDFERCGNREITVNAFKKNFPCLAAALQMIYDERNKDSSYISFGRFYQKLIYAKIPEFIAKELPNDALSKLFKIEREEPAPVRNWETREQDYRKLFGAKIIDLQPDPATALKSLKYYYDIRRERNNINHAAVHSTKPVSELRTLIDDCLAALEKMPVS